VVEWRYFNLDFSAAIPGGAGAATAGAAAASSASGGITERTKLMEHDEDESDRIDAHGVA
jgi:hypothetical protein